MAKPHTYPLELIISGTPDVFMSISNSSHHELSSVAIIQLQCKSVLQPPNGWLAFERGEASIKHKLDGVDDLLCVWSNS